jgi:membrane fusion protein (multidrug efflux system)
MPQCRELYGAVRVSGAGPLTSELMFMDTAATEQPQQGFTGTPRSERLQPADRQDKITRTKAEAAKKQSWGDYLRQHRLLVLAALLLLALIIVGSGLWWLHARQYESTDDAFIDSRVVTIGASISGPITEVVADDNRMVEAGATLVRIDDRIYRAQLDQARAQVDQSQAAIANLDAQIDAQRAKIAQAKQQVGQAQAALTFAQEEYSRATDLASRGSGTVQQAQQTHSNLIQNEASLAGAQANQVATEKQLFVLSTQRQGDVAQLEIALAQRALAETNMSYTVITAPVAGRVTKLTAAKGEYTTPGQALMMFVPRDIWITANFRETQLARMHPGQPVDIRVDAFPDHTFSGHVDSVQAGSGTAFSLLPAENATGNYVKVVQRVPVKIVFDRDPDVELGPGMSVVPTVKVQ